MIDLELVSGDFLERDIPKEKRYLLKYFTTDEQVLFLKYYLTFNHYAFFYPHTGVYQSTKWLKKMRRRFLSLDKAYQDARKEADIDAILKIESGLWPLAKNG